MLYSISFFSAVLSASFLVTKINGTAAIASWAQDSSEFLQAYTVYYVGTSISGKKRTAVEGEMKKLFPGGSSFGTIDGLNPLMDYTFQLSITYNINGVVFEGSRTHKIPAGQYDRFICKIVLYMYIQCIFLGASHIHDKN